MPWTAKKNPKLCSEAMPWAVVSLNDGEVMGCHATQGDAEAQVASLYAEEGGEPGEYSSDAMIAALPRNAEDLAQEGGLRAADLHVTLRYLGGMDQYGALDRRSIQEAAEQLAGVHSSFEAQVQGYGVLGEDRATVLFLSDSRFNDLRDGLQQHGPSDSYPHFVPHLTLGYDLPVDRAAPFLGKTVALGALRVAWGSNHRDYPLREAMNVSEIHQGGVSISINAASPSDVQQVLRYMTSTNSTQIIGSRFDAEVEEVETEVEDPKAEIDPEEEEVEVEVEAESEALLPPEGEPVPEEEEEEDEAEAEEAEEESDELKGSSVRARSRVIPVPESSTRVTDRVQHDFRNLPGEVLERLADQGQEVGVVDWAFRGLCEARFRPEFRLNNDGTCSIHGYATVYDFPYEVMGGPPYGWVETITRGACMRSVANGADVRLLINHEGIPLARTKSGTLKLESDEIGLYSLAQGLDMRSPTVQSLISAMQRGDMDEMSFAFRAEEQDWNEDYTERYITQVKLYDVSVVTYPANPAATSAVRGDRAEDEIGPDEYGLYLAQSQARASRLRDF